MNQFMSVLGGGKEPEARLDYCFYAVKPTSTQSKFSERS